MIWGDQAAHSSKSLKIHIIALTDHGLATGQRIRQLFRGLGGKSIVREVGAELWIHKNSQETETLDPSNSLKQLEDVHTFERLAEILPGLWTNSALLIFVMATGIVVRQIAPLIQRKDCDPAVLVLDEKGQYVISLLSGHLGGANAWARELAKELKAQPVITTATDVHGLIAPDEYARRLGWAVEPLQGLKKVNRWLLEHEQLNVWSEIELSPEHTLRQDRNYTFLKEDEKIKAQIWVTPFIEKEKSAYLPGIKMIPKVFSIGVGCRKGISKERVLDAIQKALFTVNASEQAIMGIFSIDIKQLEEGIIEAAEEMGLPFRTFSAAALQEMINKKGLSHSEYVKEKIGVDGVCEAASLLGTKQGQLILPKQKLNGVTIAISMERSLS